MPPPAQPRARGVAPSRIGFWAVLMGLFLGVGLPPAVACRYNVRDVGFVDLETEPYHLYFFVRDTLPADLRTRLRDTAVEALAGANILPELVETDTGKSHPALAHRPPPEPGGTFPDLAAVLVSPDPQNPPLPIALPLTRTGPAFAEALAGTLRELSDSPLRERLVERSSQAFGVILLIEGTESAANQRARQSIAEAVEQIRAQMKSLPKPIAEPPALVVIGPAEFARERVLLWALRSDTRPLAEPRAAAVYGRARWIGPMMRAAEISTRNLGGLFSLVGADCECGLDLAWTQGTRLPVRWAASLQAPLARALGFDPENPVVKTEVSWILGRRGSGSFPREETSGARQAAGPPPVEATPIPASTALPHSEPAPQAPAAPERTGSASRPTWILVGLVALGTLAAGALILARAIRRRG